MTFDDSPTVVSLRPKFQGANIGTWIGFKHILSLIEEAILQWFRDRGMGPQQLFHDHGLGLDLVDSSAQLLSLIEIDDELEAEIVCERETDFMVRLSIRRGDSRRLSARAKVRVTLLGGTITSPGRLPPPDMPKRWLSWPSADGRRDLPIKPGQRVASVLGRAGGSAVLWTWDARYFDCHYSKNVQHAAYVRALEDVVDRFLRHCGLPIGHVLKAHELIPVVSRVRVTTLFAAEMDDLIHTTFQITDVLKNAVFDGRMDCYVRRHDRLVHTATASILHGYAISDGQRAGQLAEMDHRFVQAIHLGAPS